jgi:hypothetical protein
VLRLEIRLPHRQHGLLLVCRTFCHLEDLLPPLEEERIWRIILSHASYGIALISTYSLVSLDFKEEQAAQRPHWTVGDLLVRWPSSGLDELRPVL